MRAWSSTLSSPLLLAHRIHCSSPWRLPSVLCAGHMGGVPLGTRRSVADVGTTGPGYAAGCGSFAPAHVARHSDVADRLCMPTGPGWWAPPRRLDDGWALLDEMLGFWLEGAEVRPMLERPNGKPTITWGSAHAPLFGTIAVQLLMLVTQTAGLAQCSGCGNSYIPRRKPRDQQRSYCADCRVRKVPQRDAQRDKRSRTKLRV